MPLDGSSEVVLPESTNSVDGTAAQQRAAVPLPRSVRLRAGLVRLPRPAWVGDLQLLPALLALGAVLSVTASGFLTTTNLINILSQSAIVAIAAIGATYVILAAGIDLSVASTMGASGVVAAAVMNRLGSVPLGIAAGVATGAGVGLVLGWLIARFHLVPFVVTLAGLFFVQGLTTLVTAGGTLAQLPNSFGDIGFNTVAGVPIPVIVTVVLYITGQWALTRTVWGRKVLLVGANPRAAEISGINVRRTVWSTYVVAGALAGVAGVLLTATLLGANASMAQPELLTIVGVVVIGGTSLFGGTGSIVRTGLGVLFLGTLSNGLSILGLQSFDQQTATGAAILAAAGLDVLLHRKRG